MNQFSYEVVYLCIPLSRLYDAELADILPINRKGFVSFFEQDHGARDGSSIEGWVRKILGVYELNELIDEIVLVTIPRMLNYVFNPVSFWLCYDIRGRLLAVLCEVNNTFGETHSYLCMHEDKGAIQAEDWLTTRKVFHVSPFLPREGAYRFRFDDSGKRLSVWIDYYDRDDQKQLVTALTGTLATMTKYSLRRAFRGASGIDDFSHYADSLASIPVVDKRDTPYQKTIAERTTPYDDNTWKTGGGKMLAQASIKKFLATLEKLQFGTLSVEMPDGKQYYFSGHDAGPHAALSIYNWRAIPHLSARGSTGLAEAYRDGWLEVDSLVSLLRIGLQNEHIFDQYIHGGYLSRYMSRMLYFFHRNTLRGSRRNIHAHYDIGNDFYSLWLDSGMTYSSGLFSVTSGLTGTGAAE